jgi:hypothetical protein
MLVASALDGSSLMDQSSKEFSGVLKKNYPNLDTLMGKISVSLVSGFWWRVSLTIWSHPFFQNSRLSDYDIFQSPSRELRIS